MNTCNLFLVWTLRSSVKFINSRSQSHSVTGPPATGGINWDAKVEEGQIDSGCRGFTRRIWNSSLFGSKAEPGTSSSQVGTFQTYSPSNQDMAMKRLAADLSVAIPCVLAMVTIMVVGLAVLIDKHFENLTWTIQEFVRLRKLMIWDFRRLTRNLRLTRP